MDKEGLVSFNDPVEVTAEVRSSILFNNDYRLGVCFKEIKEKDERNIGNFLGSILKTL